MNRASWLTEDRAIRLLQLHGWRVLRYSGGLHAGYLAYHPVHGQINGGSPLSLLQQLADGEPLAPRWMR